MVRSRRDDWDDWDDEPEKVEDKPSLFTTRRILIGLALTAFAALILGGVLRQEQMQFGEVPDVLVGTWTCDDPVHSDLWLEFTRDSVVFGERTSRLKYRVLGVDLDPVGNIRRFSVLYKDMAGKKHYLELLLDASADTLRRTDRPALAYQRYR
jgi:hypothetical protein